ncbi:hypothetical protein C8J57DRAFT_1456975 [Mycena rebaudengoi]|nr:hypothetical protein C8J57DRAFT_1456975 [Mycena rebaudengoi]
MNRANINPSYLGNAVKLLGPPQRRCEHPETTPRTQATQHVIAERKQVRNVFGSYFFLFLPRKIDVHLRTQHRIVLYPINEYARQPMRRDGKAQLGHMYNVSRAAGPSVPLSGAAAARSRPGYGGRFLSPGNGGRALGMGAEVRGGKGRAGGCLYDWGKKGRTGRERAEEAPLGGREETSMCRKGREKGEKGRAREQLRRETGGKGRKVDECTYVCLAEGAGRRAEGSWERSFDSGCSIGGKGREEHGEAGSRPRAESGERDSRLVRRYGHDRMRGVRIGRAGNDACLSASNRRPEATTTPVLPQDPTSPSTPPPPLCSACLAPAALCTAPGESPSRSTTTATANHSNVLQATRHSHPTRLCHIYDIHHRTPWTPLLLGFGVCHLPRTTHARAAYRALAPTERPAPPPLMARAPYAPRPQIGCTDLTPMDDPLATDTTHIAPFGQSSTNAALRGHPERPHRRNFIFLLRAPLILRFSCSKPRADGSVPLQARHRAGKRSSPAPLRAGCAPRQARAGDLLRRDICRASRNSARATSHKRLSDVVLLALPPSRRRCPTMQCRVGRRTGGARATVGDYRESGAKAAILNLVTVPCLRLVVRGWGIVIPYLAGQETLSVGAQIAGRVYCAGSSMETLDSRLFFNLLNIFGLL